MKSGADFKQTANSSAEFDLTGSRFRDSAENLEQRRLAGAVATNHSQHFTLSNVETHVLQRPDLPGSRAIEGRLASGQQAHGRLDGIHYGFAQRAIVALAAFT